MYTVTGQLIVKYFKNYSELYKYNQWNSKIFNYTFTIAILFCILENDNLINRYQRKGSKAFAILLREAKVYDSRGATLRAI